MDVLLWLLVGPAAAGLNHITANVVVPVPAPGSRWTVHQRRGGGDGGRVPPVTMQKSGLTVTCGLDGEWVDITLTGGETALPDAVSCTVGNNLVTLRLIHAGAPDPGLAAISHPDDPDSALVVERYPTQETHFEQTGLDYGSKTRGQLLLDGRPWPGGTCALVGSDQIVVDFIEGSPNGRGVCRINAHDVPVIARPRG